MNAATLSAQPVTAAKASLRTGNAAPQAANPMQEIDQLIQPVARQIAVLLRPLTDGWTWGAEFPGKSAVLAADGVLLDMSMGPEEWANETRSRPPTGRMLDDLKHHLHEAVNQIEAAQDFDPGPRRLLMLLLREAVAQDHALGRAFGEALAKRYQSLRYLAAGAGGQLATTETMEIASDTPLVNAGKDAANIALWCSYDIETLAAEVTLLGEECDFEGNVGLGAKARCFGVRIGSLNAIIMSYLGDDAEITIGETHTTYYGGAKPFKTQEGRT